MTDKLSKAEKRAARQKEKTAAQKVKSVKFADTAPVSTVMKIKIAQIHGLGLKAVKSHEIPPEEKRVYIPTQQKLTSDCGLTWCVTHSDTDGEWSWKESRQWSKLEWDQDIAPNFAALQKSTWYELLHVHKTPAKGDRLVAKNHYQEIHTLVKEAQDRWTELGLDEHDTAFRFRFGNKVRAWGIKLAGHFYLVWWEKHHKIYPVGH